MSKKLQKYCFSKDIDFEKPMNKPNLQQIQNNKMFLSCEVTKERGIYEKRCIYQLRFS